MITRKMILILGSIIAICACAAGCGGGGGGNGHHEPGQMSTAYLYNSVWSDPVDSDYDGYMREKKLNFDIDTDASRMNVYARLFYKNASSSSYTHFYTTGTFTVNGDSTDDARYITVAGLSHGTYDFMLEIYSDDGTFLNRYYPDEVPALGGISLETPSQDGAAPGAHVFGAAWSDAVDTDADGYADQARLNFDVDTSADEVLVYAKISYKTSAATSYSAYYTTENFSVYGNSASDARYVLVQGLPHDAYDFDIKIYSYTDILLDEYGPADDADLNGSGFEIEGNGMYVYETYWGEQADGDGDGYKRKANLYVDVDSATDADRTVFMKIYYKQHYNTNYTLLYTTREFTIHSDSSADSYWVTIDPDLNADTFDFKVEVYAHGSLSPEFTALPSSDTALNGAQFETKSEDGGVFIYDMACSEGSDTDLDAYFLDYDCQMDADAPSGSHDTVYTEMYYRPAYTVPDYTYWFTTGNWDISGNSAYDKSQITVGGESRQLSRDEYDVLFMLYSGNRLQDFYITTMKLEDYNQDHGY